jgi:hypothetical protein
MIQSTPFKYCESKGIKELMQLRQAKSTTIKTILRWQRELEEQQAVKMVECLNKIGLRIGNNALKRGEPTNVGCLI